MHKKAGKYTTVIGTECDNYGEWYKTDMFFGSSRSRSNRGSGTRHLPEKVTLPQQVLVIGDGSAEKRSYDELGNQRDLYAKRPGHAPVAQVGLKGVFLKAEPSSDELIVQLKWMAANVEQFLQKATASQTKVWDLTKFPEWACLEKVGANACSTLSKGSSAPTRWRRRRRAARRPRRRRRRRRRSSRRSWSCRRRSRRVLQTQVKLHAEGGLCT